jgi:hypothetical protein
MYLTGYVPRPLGPTAIVRPIFTIPSRNILITRMTSNGWDSCSELGAETFTLSTGGQAQYVMTLSNNPTTVNDSGPLSIAVPAGTAVWVISGSTPFCLPTDTSPGDIAISVEYVMQ